ncbi:hypothetical protein DMH15_18175 [Streptomyces sp. WAC 06725]|uniref:hypothetical protein n=1 Tax=Streptomyces sp. WAC 06725 TaxID=2203209 RepID=UPI000F73AC92|nr:hypothetical protein [Streptomyces sp. WAC 06725]RSO37535.1 hypothetical protein DMH15_18175 [Streptomyces sp. WAC 06725]
MMPLPHAPTDPCVRAPRMRLPTSPREPRPARESVSAVLDPHRYALGDGRACLSEAVANATVGGPFAEDGRGLEVLGALADGWGFDRTRSGKWVWFRVRHPRSDTAEGQVAA